MIQEPTSHVRLLDTYSAPTNRPKRQDIGPFSLVFFGWVLPLLRTARRKLQAGSALSEEDLLPLWWGDDVARNVEAATRLWTERHGSFRHMFWQLCGGQFLLAGLCGILGIGCSLGQPILLRSFLLEFVQDPSAPW